MAELRHLTESQVAELGKGTMVWWLWISVALLLLIGEAVVPGSVFLIFFALGAGLVGLISFMGGEMGLSLELTIFALSSLALCWGLRPLIRSLVNRGEPRQSSPSVVGQRAICISDIPRGQRGRVECRGTTWNASNTGRRDLMQGEEAIVETIDGLLLKITSPEHQ